MAGNTGFATGQGAELPRTLARIAGGKGRRMEAWTDFFVAEVGASAALAGLLVVAMSINVARIIAINLLPERARHMLFMIGYILILSSLGLFPNVSPWLFGLVCLLTALALLFGNVRFLLVSLRLRGDNPLLWTLSPVGVSLIVTVPMIVGGIYLMQGDLRGLDWIGASILMGFVATLQNGWVLMVEILR